MSSSCSASTESSNEGLGSSTTTVTCETGSIGSSGVQGFVTGTHESGTGDSSGSVSVGIKIPLK